MTPPENLNTALLDLERACGAYIERRITLGDLAAVMHLANGLMARVVQSGLREERV